MKNRLRNFFLGKPLKDSELANERLNTFWGIPVFSSDTISTVTYAGEEILIVLIPLLGIAAYRRFLWITAALMALLLILVLGYRQTISAYPQGGGGYTVALHNLGERPGVVAGASLVIGYVLIVAVSASAASAAVVSVFPSAASLKKWIALLLIFFLSWLHLRGTRAAALIVGVPTYLFVLTMLVMIVRGVVQWNGIAYVTTSAEAFILSDRELIFLMLRAFASGCTALAGIEAVSNGVASFRAPAQRTAKRVLVGMGVIVAVVFMGISWLSSLYRVVPTNDETVMSKLAVLVFGQGSVMYYLVQLMTVIILSLAANTAFADLPHLMAMMAEDRYLPRRLVYRGSRLNYTNGIAFLFFASGVLTLVFDADQHRLLPLFASGVFISFFLNQLGMLRYWRRTRGEHWIWHSAVNALALAATSITLTVLIVTRFVSGAWVTLLSIALLTELMLAIRRHYNHVSKDLAISSIEDARNMLSTTRSRKAILPVSTINRAFIKSVNCALDIGFSEIELYHVGSDEARALQLKAQIEAMGLDSKFVYEITEFRNMEDILVRHIEEEHERLEHFQHLTVIIPILMIRNPFKQYLHNEVSRALMRRLSSYRYVYIFQVPYLFE